MMLSPKGPKGLKILQESSASASRLETKNAEHIMSKLTMLLSSTFFQQFSVPFEQYPI